MVDTQILHKLQMCDIVMQIFKCYTVFIVVKLAIFPALYNIHPDFIATRVFLKIGMLREFPFWRNGSEPY